jgi:hypothetical protein
MYYPNHDLTTPGGGTSVPLSSAISSAIPPKNKPGTEAISRARRFFKIHCNNAYPTSSKIAFRTLVGTAAYFSGSITDDARPVLIERNSVV